MRRGATSPSTRCRADPVERRDLRLFRRPRRSRGAPGALHRRSADPHRRGSSADPALLPLPRPLRRRASPTRPALDACAARANDLMALSRERIADELLKLLALPDPVADGPADDRARHLRAGPARDRRSARPARRAGRSASGRPASRPKPCAGSPPCCRPIREVAAVGRGAAAPVEAAAKRLVSAADSAARATRRRSPTEIGAEEAVDRFLLAGQDRTPTSRRWRAGSGRGCRSAAAT